MRTETESSQKGGFGHMDEKLHVTSARKLAIATNLMAAIKQTDMGKNAEKWDFLHTSSNATYITQRTINISRSCIAIFWISYHLNLKLS